MKTYWVIYEVSGQVHWDTITASDEEDANRRMTLALVAQGYAEADIIIREVAEWSA